MLAVWSRRFSMTASGKSHAGDDSCLLVFSYLIVVSVFLVATDLFGLMGSTAEASVIKSIFT